MTQRRSGPPNEALSKIIESSGASHKALARRVNQLAEREGLRTRYTHTSITNWTRRGMTPDPPVPTLLAVALSERLGRPVSALEIGMDSPPAQAAQAGLEFARDPREAVGVATDYWRLVNRRRFLESSFAISAFGVPVTRWLAKPADDDAARAGGRRVGRKDLEELWEAADEARRWDARYGGGNWRAESVTLCLERRVAPLLHGRYTDEVGRDLFAAAAELSRVAGWCAVDAAHHDAAQRHLIQALRLARAGGNVELGGYVLTTMALHALLRGWTSEAIDMAQGAYERAKHTSAPRVLAFTKLIEARAHGRARDRRAAGAALTAAEELLDRAGGDREPEWIKYVTHARLSADATEIYRDLHLPAAALRWNDQASAMSPHDRTRSVGLRLTVVGTVHLQAGDLDRGLALGDQAVDVLGAVESSRARDYLEALSAALAPWEKEKQVARFRRRVRASV